MGRKQTSNDIQTQKNRDRALAWYYDHREQVLEKQRAAYAENKSNRARLAELEAELERLRGELDEKK